MLVADFVVQRRQAVTEFSQGFVILQGFIQLFGATDARQATQTEGQPGAGTQPLSRSAHGQGVATASHGLLTARPHLRNNLSDTLFLIKPDAGVYILQ